MDDSVVGFDKEAMYILGIGFCPPLLTVGAGEGQGILGKSLTLKNRNGECAVVAATPANVKKYFRLILRTVNSPS